MIYIEIKDRYADKRTLEVWFDQLTGSQYDARWTLQLMLI